MVRSGKHVNVGDHIPYVLCTTPRLDGGAKKLAGNKASFAERAFHPDEVTRSQAEASKTSVKGEETKADCEMEALTDSNDAQALSIDVEWYLTQQLLPPISRLCLPISEISQAALAEKLGSHFLELFILLKLTCSQCNR
jgi:DNA polymerase alpha subunit A